MKIVDIITAEMHQLHGANKVTEKLILGRKYLESNGFYLRYVISQDGIVDCSNYKSSLGVHLNEENYQKSRKRIEILKKIPIYNSYFIQKFLVKKEFEDNKKVCEYVESVKNKADIIIFQDPYTAIYYLKKTNDNTKCIFISHADTDPLEHLLMGRPAIKGSKTEFEIRNMYKFLFEHVNAVVTICSSSQKYMLETYNIDSPCIINGIEDKKLNVSQKYSNKDNVIHLAIVASLQYRKGQDIAIEAVAKLSNDYRKRVKLHILGGGYEYDDLKNKVEELKISSNVRFYGPVLDVDEYLPKMDAFLLPSRADTVPISIIEAMRAGLPIFASDVGEIASMIGDCGDLILPNVDSVYKLYIDLITNKYDLQRLGEKARSRFLNEFQLQTMMNKYAMVLNRLNE